MQPGMPSQGKQDEHMGYPQQQTVMPNEQLPLHTSAGNAKIGFLVKILRPCLHRLLRVPVMQRFL